MSIHLHTRTHHAQVIFTHLIDRVQNANPNATQTLILAHRRELVEQAANHCERTYPKLSVEIEMGPVHATGRADITVASVQTLAKEKRLQKFDPESFKLILVDEAHHIVAPGYAMILKHFGLETPNNASPALVGVSATFSRFDGRKLGSAIDHIVYHKDYIDMIGEKWLSDVLFTTVKSHAVLDNVKSGANADFLPTALSRAVTTEATNEITVKSWLARAKDERRSTIVFAVDVAHVKGLTKTFRKYGIDARYITGESKSDYRHQTVQAFKDYEFPVLLNCGVFTEGTDIPNIDCVLLARPTRSRNLLVQMIGRGMRLYPGKKNCHVVDMVSSLKTGIVAVPTLFGLEPTEAIEEADIKKLEVLKRQKDLSMLNAVPAIETGDGSRRNMVSSSRVTFTDYDSVYDLIEDSSTERFIRGISRFSWAMVDEDKYVFQGMRGDYVVIEKDNENGSFYKVRYVPKLAFSRPGKSPYGRAKQIAMAEEFEVAVHAADTFIKDEMSLPYNYASTNASWRRAAATTGQIEFLNRFRESHEKLTEQDLSKGKAAEMITKIKHGARGRWGQHERKLAGQVREQAKAKKLVELRNRETVRTGPLDA
jgi:ATP-dependent helicase IRC3